MKVALVGAESTGKTQLAGELAVQLRLQGKQVAVVDEALRRWCEREGRAPRPAEQLPIAQEQESRVDLASHGDGVANDIVIADTTALMVAIYSGMLFEDGELLRFALERQRRYDVTLLTGLDLPWVADGLQREGPLARDRVDAQLRDLLTAGGISFRVVYGEGETRVANALAALGSAPQTLGDPIAAEAQSRPRRWQWNCDKCSDPGCEHRLFTLGPGAVPAGSKIVSMRKSDR
ncbi:MAG: ATP-binding protein [Ramlibacter sp.]|nr:ATP-binding protein [Ramlibacter sp.]